MRITASILFLVFCAGSASGSVRHVEISKSNHSESPIDFSVAGTPDEYGYVSVKITLPPEQEDLAHLWRIELWIEQDDKHMLSVVIVPILEEDKTISIGYRGHVDFIDHCLIAIRCGEFAPLVETIYKIDVDSYIDVELDHSTSEPDGNPE